MLTDGTVVVADDEPTIRMVVADVLRDCLGVCPELVQDGWEALVRVRELRPRLLLLDWMMPRLDGLGVVEALRAEPPSWPMATLIMSAAPIRDVAAQSGCTGFIPKPFVVDDLIQAVERCLK